MKDTGGIGGRIKELRAEFGLTQADLARTLSVTEQAVSKWENGLGMPDVMNISALTDVFDTTMDYLVRGTGPVHRGGGVESQARPAEAKPTAKPAEKGETLPKFHGEAADNALAIRLSGGEGMLNVYFKYAHSSVRKATVELEAVFDGNDRRPVARKSALYGKKIVAFAGLAPGQYLVRITQTGRGNEVVATSEKEIVLGTPSVHETNKNETG